MLSFSADGADDFAEKEMKEESPGTFVAEIPASATQGGRVDYFIDALGDNDVGLASKGSEKDTLKIAMLGPNGQPLVRGHPQGKKPPEKPAADESPSLLFGLGVGSGVGWTTGNGEINGRDKRSTRRVRDVAG